MKLPGIPTSLAGITNLVRYGDRPRPLRDWLVIASIAVVLLIGSAGWSYFLFQMISTETEAATAASASTSVSTNVLDTVRSIFEKRAVERTHYLSGYTFVDPSR